MRNNLPSRTSPIAVGDLAPDFTLLDQNKKEWKLSDAVKHGDVVLSFVPFAFTGVCSTEMKCISADIAKWSAKGATVVGIDCDSVYANRNWTEKEGYTHTILSDLHRDVTKAYGLYWADQNVSGRGTVVIGKCPDGKGKVKFVEAREPSKAMNWEQVLGLV